MRSRKDSVLESSQVKESRPSFTYKLSHMNLPEMVSAYPASRRLPHRDEEKVLGTVVAKTRTFSELQQTIVEQNNMLRPTLKPNLMRFHVLEQTAAQSEPKRSKLRQVLFDLAGVVKQPLKSKAPPTEPEEPAKKTTPTEFVNNWLHGRTGRRPTTAKKTGSWGKQVQQAESSPPLRMISLSSSSSSRQQPLK